MRKIVANDKEHFYTYSKEFLSGSFPIINENQIKVKAKLDSESKWQTKNGFDKLGKKTNWNEHPYKPDVAKMDELRYPHYKQSEDTKRTLARKQYRPQDDGKSVFQTKVKHPHQTFSQPNYFKTVFISGDGMA